MLLYYLIVIKGDMCGPQSEINLSNCPMFLDLQYEDRGCIDPAIRILIGVARKNYSLVFVVISYFGVKFVGEKICRHRLASMHCTASFQG